MTSHEKEVCAIAVPAPTVMIHDFLQFWNFNGLDL